MTAMLSRVAMVTHAPTHVSAALRFNDGLGGAPTSPPREADAKEGARGGQAMEMGGRAMRIDALHPFAVPVCFSHWVPLGGLDWSPGTHGGVCAHERRSVCCQDMVPGRGPRSRKASGGGSADMCASKCAGRAAPRCGRPWSSSRGRTTETRGRAWRGPGHRRPACRSRPTTAPAHSPAVRALRCGCLRLRPLTWYVPAGKHGWPDVRPGILWNSARKWTRKGRLWTTARVAGSDFCGEALSRVPGRWARTSAAPAEQAGAENRKRCPTLNPEHTHSSQVAIVNCRVNAARKQHTHIV